MPMMVRVQGSLDNPRTDSSLNREIADRKMEMILPYDFNTLTIGGRYIHSIPDLSLEALLAELSQQKGGNIVSNINTG